MSRKKITKILVLLLVLCLILIQTCRVGATSLGEILQEGESDTSTDLNDLLTPSNEANPNTSDNTANNTTTNTTSNTTNTNTSLPKTGTNENIIIGLMVICIVAGVYAFKKVKDYNM